MQVMRFYSLKFRYLLYTQSLLGCTESDHITIYYPPLSVSGHVQDRECMQRPGTCGAPTYLQGVTQGEQVPAECLSRSVIIMYKSKYIHGGLYLSRSEKKAAFSSYSSPALYNRWVTRRKGLCHGTPHPHAPQPSPIISDSVRLHSSVTLMHT